MAREIPTLERWFSVPDLARDLSNFLNGPAGRLVFPTIQHYFRPVPDNEAALEKHGLRNAGREGVQAVLELIDLMSVPKEPKERQKDEGWGVEPLRRETDPVPIPQKPKRGKKP